MSVEVGICLDASGSMADIWEVTTKGFAEYMNDLRRASDAKVTLATFSGSYVTVQCSSVDPAEVGELSRYCYPAGKTPLNDAIVSLIETLRRDSNPEVGKLVVTHTDGGENFSRKNSVADVRYAVTQAIADGWGFLYVGVGMSEAVADRQAQAYGMPSGSVLAVSRQATRAAFRKISKETTDRSSVRTP